MNTTTKKIKSFLLITILGVLTMTGYARAEEVRGGASSAGLSQKVISNPQNAADLSHLVQYVKQESPETLDVLKAAKIVIASCQRLKQCNLTKETLVSMVKHAVPKEIKVAELVNFDAMFEGSSPAANQPNNQRQALAGDPFLGL